MERNKYTVHIKTSCFRFSFLSPLLLPVQFAASAALGPTVLDSGKEILPSEPTIQSVSGEGEIGNPPPASGAPSVELAA